MIFKFFFFTFLIIFFQPFFSFIFFFLLTILDYFFQNKTKELFFNLIILSFLTDLIFLKPLGYFLALSSFCFLILSLLEKIFPHHFFYQRLVYLLIFNFLFSSLFFYLNYNVFLLTTNFFKTFSLNFVFQLLYLIRKRK
jgi:hypothetical protein